jgi:PAS domain S-box-containing protein
MTEQSLTDTLSETLSLFEEGGEPLTTTDVAEQVDLGRRSTYERLDRLVNCGRLETKKVGANARVWWRPQTGDLANYTRQGAESELGVLDRADVGIVILDDSFSVAWMNETAGQYFGLDRSEIVEGDNPSIADEETAPTVSDSTSFAETLQCTSNGNTESERFECHVTAGEGRVERWLEYNSTPIESGSFAGGRIELYYDVTSRKRPEQTTLADHSEFESLVRSVEDYAIFMLDTDGYVRTWNRGAERIKGYEADEIIGEHVSKFYTDADRTAGVPEANLAAADTGSCEDDGWRVRADGSKFWAKVTITAVRDSDGTLQGYAKVTHDMTEQRERERQLRRERDLSRQLFEVAPVRFAVFDADGTLERANAAARERLGIDASDPSTFQLSDSVFYNAEGERISTADHPVRRILDTEEPVAEQLIQHDTPDGERRWVVLSGSPTFDEAGMLERVVIAGKDVTEIKRTQQQLERERDELEHELATVFERIDDAFFALDEDWQFVHVNDRAAELVGHSIGELLGQRIWDAFPETVSSTFRAEYERAVERQESVTFEEYYPPLESWFEVAAYPSESGLSVYYRDVTERKEREQELEQYETVIETVGDGVYMLDADNRFVLVNDAHCALTGYDRGELLGSHASLVTTAEHLDHAEESRNNLIDSAGDVATVETELHTADDEVVPIETRFALVPVGDGAYGRAGVVRDISDRKEHERKLERQREQLAALNSLNNVVHEITSAVIGQSTRTEIEEIVCELLAESDSYLFAWVGEVDTGSETVTLRTEAGVEGYLDDIVISVDPDDERSEGATGRAFRTGETQTTQELAADSRYEPWHDRVEPYGFRSSAAIPIVHEGSMYGTLNVYAERPNAFEGQEGVVIEQLGEIVGHAIAATERKQALLSDELVELQFHIPDVFGMVDIDEELSGTVTLEHFLSIGNDDFLGFGTVEPEAADGLRALVDAVSHWKQVTIRDDTNPWSFELRLSEPPVLSLVAGLGGAVEQARIDDGDYEMTIHVPPSVNVQQIIHTVEDAYPSIQLRKRKQVTRDVKPAEQLQYGLLDDLTDRQRTVLETAWHSGFFDWPRNASGEDIAASLGIAAPTFHQHLRKAERKMVATLFDV